MPFQISHTIAPPRVRIACAPDAARRLAYLLNSATAVLEPTNEHERKSIAEAEELAALLTKELGE
jgi:hypothetical protein